MIIIRPSGMGNCFTCGQQSGRSSVQGLRGALGVIGMLGDGPTAEEVAAETAGSASPPSEATLTLLSVGGYIGMGIMALGAGLAGYHGYKRSGGSVGSAVGWGLLGGLVPIITVPVAFAQGFGKRRR